MIRLSRRSRFGPAVIAATLLGLGSAAGLAAPHAQAADPVPPNEFSCRASVVRVQGEGPLSSLKVEPIVANDGNPPGSGIPCRTAHAGGVTVGLPTGAGDHVSVVTADTNDNEPCPSVPCPQVPFSGTADARVLEAQVGGTLLRAQVLTAHAQGNDPDGICGPAQPTLSGDSHVAQVVINGTVIEVPADKNTTVPLGVGTLFLRREINEGNVITERALELELNGLLDVVVSEAKADINPNNNFATDCIVIDNQCPNPNELDPFVDPTAEDTQGLHPDCAEFSEPKPDPGEDADADAHDFVHFVRSINDTETSPNGSFTPDNPPGDDDPMTPEVEETATRNRFNGKAGFFEDGDTTPSIEGDIYDDEDMHFRLAPLTIDAYLAPEDLAHSPWRRFCGTGVIEPFDEDMTDGVDSPVAPFEAGQVRKYMIETFDKKFLDPDAPGGDQSDYFVIDIYAPGSDFDTTQCDPVPGGEDHGQANPDVSTLDYHSEGQTIAGNIEIHSERVADTDNDDTTPL